MTAGRKLIQRANNKSLSSKTKTMTLQYKVKHGRETACSNIHHIHFVYGIYIFSRCVHVLCFIQGKKSHGIFLRFWQKTHSAYDNNHTSCVRHKSNTKNHSRARLLRKCRRKKKCAWCVKESTIRHRYRWMVSVRRVEGTNNGFLVAATVLCERLGNAKKPKCSYICMDWANASEMLQYSNRFDASSAVPHHHTNEDVRARSIA